MLDRIKGRPLAALTLALALLVVARAAAPGAGARPFGAREAAWTGGAFAALVAADLGVRGAIARRATPHGVLRFLSSLRLARRDAGAAGLLAAPCLAAGEEAIFRGTLLPILATPFGGPAAVLAAALAHAGLHAGPEMARHAAVALARGLILGAFVLAAGHPGVAILARTLHEALWTVYLLWIFPLEWRGDGRLTAP